PSPPTTNTGSCLSKLLRQAAAVEKIFTQRLPARPVSTGHRRRTRAGGGVSQNRRRRLRLDRARADPRHGTRHPRRTNVPPRLRRRACALPHVALLAAEYSVSLERN